jgi:deaminated glutathione amidase
MRMVAVQLNGGASWPQNRQQIDGLLAQLPTERPCLVLLPENFACLGDSAAYQQWAEPLGDGPIQRQLVDWARQWGIWLVAGSLPTRVDGETRLHTSSLVYSPEGQLQGHYHKLHLFDVDVADGHGQYRESASFIPGERWCVVPSPFGGLGLSICYDVRFPELYRQLRVAGADILLVPAAFTYLTGQAHWLALLRARAIENQCYVLAANQCGEHAGGRQTWGHSVIIDPWGQVVAEAGHTVGVIHAELDPQFLNKIRTDMPVLHHARLRDGWREAE